jgi:hypothetical protein
VIARPRPAMAVMAAILAIGLLAPVAGIAPAPAFAASTDLTLVTDAVYTVETDAGRVAVAVTINAANHTKETRTRRFYFDHAYLAVQPGATDVRLAGSSKARARVARRTATSTLLRLDFGARIYSGKHATYRLTFDLPGTGPDASPQVRVGAGLITIPVWAFASNGASGSTVAVRFPAGWDVTVESGELARRPAAGGSGTVLASGPLDHPLTFFAFVTAQRPAAHTERTVTLPVGGQQVELRLQGWADDPEWMARIESLYGRALPVLREDIGLPWPIEQLTVVETVNRDQDAYASLFDPAQARVEIAYWADHGVIVHQVAHGWFNSSLLAERWANEGFATYYALHAAQALDEAADAPVMTEEAEAARVPLNAWPGSTGLRTPTDAYGYAASAQLADELARRVGPRVLREVWADAAARVGAYQPDGGARRSTASTPGGAAGALAVSGQGGRVVTAATTTTAPAEPEHVDGPPDWRGLLDLLEERSGQDLTALWRDVVVTPDQAPLLDARAEARAVYARTLALAGDWTLPRDVRDAMRAWDFPTAQARMADARTVLASRNALDEIAAQKGIPRPGSMQDLFEAGDLAGASARAEAERNAILTVDQAERSRSTVHDPLTSLGMLGEHPERDLAEARAALAAGDLDTALAAAERAYRAWTAASEEGRRRALFGLAVLATLLVLLSATASTMRRMRRGRDARTGAAAGERSRPPGDGTAIG